MELDNFKELLKNIVHISHLAGDAIMGIYERHETETTYKEGGSPLTNADLLANSIIIKNLEKITPHIPILSEESKAIPYHTRKQWETFWLIDPLDGTKEFVNRTDEFTVNIALIFENRPVLGVVYAPAINCVYFAREAEGAFKLNGRDWKKKKEIRVSDYQTDMVTIVSTRSHKNELLANFIGKIKGAKVISIGSSLKFCLVAEGAAHLYPRLGPTMEWDTAAAQCVVSAAGGTVTDIKKNNLCYNKPDLNNPDFFVCGSPPFPWCNYIF